MECLLTTEDSCSGQLPLREENNHREGGVERRPEPSPAGLAGLVGLSQHCPAPSRGPCPMTRTISHIWTPHPCHYLMFSSAASQAGVPSPQDAAGPVSFQAGLGHDLLEEAAGRTPLVACDPGIEVMLAPCTPNPKLYYSWGPQKKIPRPLSLDCVS